MLLIVVEGRVSDFSYFLYLLHGSVDLTFRKGKLTFIVLSGGDVLLGVPDLVG